MMARYFAALLRFAFKGVVLRADALQILAAAIFPAIFKLLGIRMPENAQAAFLVYIGYAIGAFVLIRFVTAPYFLWKEDQNRIADLTSQIVDPDEEKKAHRQEIKRELSRVLVPDRLRIASKIVELRDYPTPMFRTFQELKNFHSTIRDMSHPFYVDINFASLLERFFYHHERAWIFFHPTKTNLERQELLELSNHNNRLGSHFASAAHEMILESGDEGIAVRTLPTGSLLHPLEEKGINWGVDYSDPLKQVVTVNIAGREANV